MRSQQPSASGPLGASAGAGGGAGSGSMVSGDGPVKLDTGVVGTSGRTRQLLQQQQQMGPGGLVGMPGAQGGGGLEHSTSMSRFGMSQTPSPSALGAQVRTGSSGRRNMYCQAG